MSSQNTPEKLRKLEGIYVEQKVRQALNLLRETGEAELADALVDSLRNGVFPPIVFEFNPERKIHTMVFLGFPSDTQIGCYSNVDGFYATFQLTAEEKSAAQGEEPLTRVYSYYVSKSEQLTGTGGEVFAPVISNVNSFKGYGADRVEEGIETGFRFPEMRFTKFAELYLKTLRHGTPLVSEGAVYLGLSERLCASLGGLARGTLNRLMITYVRESPAKTAP